MQENFIFPQPNIAELFSSVYHRGTIARIDRLGLMAAFLSNTLTTEESLAIDRLLYAIRRGRVKILD